MSYDDTIQPFAYSFRGNSIPNTNNFSDNNINLESYNCGFIYPDATLAVVYTSNPATNSLKKFYKVFVWEWENRDRDYVNSQVEELLVQHFFYSYAPDVSFILDPNCNSPDYKKLCSRISSNFIHTGNNFRGDDSKENYISDVKVRLINSQN